MIKNCLFSVSMAILMFCAPAQAAVVDLGTVTPGATNVPVPGDLTLTPIPVPGLSLYQLDGTVSGVLPAQSVITFSYAFGGGIAGNSTITSTFNTQVNPTTATATPGSSGFASAPLGFVTANLNLPNSATTVVANNGLSSVTFASILSVILNGAGISSLTYSVSSIPLPATLPMFLAILGGLFLYGRINSKRNGMAKA